MAQSIIHSNFDLLWENPNPTANFAAQTISLDLSRFSFVRISFYWYTGNNDLIAFTQDCPVGRQSRAFRAEAYANKQVYISQRDVAVADSGITFGDCTQASSTTNKTTANQAVVPAAIWGIK